MGELGRDLRHALLRLRREPAVSLPSILILALAIGAAVTTFSAVEGVLLRPLPYGHPGRLVLLWHRTTEGGGRRSRIPAPDVPELRRLGHTLAGVAFTNDVFDAVMAGGGARPGHLTVGLVTPNFFSVLGVRPKLGRAFRPGEAVLPPAAFGDTAFVAPPSVVVLGYDLWQSRFGSDPAVLGRTIRLNGTPFTVIGVAPRGFRLLMPPDVGLATDVDAWTPLRIPPALFERPKGRWQDQDSDNTGAVIARMAPGATLQDVRTEMRAIAARQRETIPAYRNEDVHIEVRPMLADVVARVRPALLVLLGAVALVLLVASLNVAGLLLARNLDRVAELRLRVALGADRGHLVREVLAHSLVLASAGAAAGLLLASWGIGILPALAPAGIPRLASLRMDAPVVAFAVLSAVVAALAAGLLPALAATRSLGSGLATSVANRSTRHAGRSGPALVAAQVAFSLVLLVGAGLLLRSFVRLQEVPPGFEPRGLVTLRLSLRDANLRGPSDRATFLKRFTGRIRSLPGVRAVGVVGGLPLGGEVSSRPWGPASSPPTAWTRRRADFRVISSGYFRAMGTRLLAGRAFTEREDVVEASRVAIVDATLARRLSPDGTPAGAVGRRLGFPLDGEAVEATVVGVVAPIHYEGLRGAARTTIYAPYRQEASRTVGIAVRSAASPADLEREVRSQLRDLHAASLVPVFDFRPMEAYVAASTAPTRFALFLVAAFALVTLVLVAVGVYGTVAYAVRRKRREIGIRMAVGATPAAVLRRFALRGLTPVALGTAAGLLLAALASQTLASFLVGVPPMDVPTFGAVASGMLLIGGLACLFPAREATRVEPSEVLREE